MGVLLNLIFPTQCSNINLLLQCCIISFSRDLVTDALAFVATKLPVKLNVAHSEFMIKFTGEPFHIRVQKRLTEHVFSLLGLESLTLDAILELRVLFFFGVVCSIKMILSVLIKSS